MKVRRMKRKTDSACGADGKLSLKYSPLLPYLNATNGGEGEQPVMENSVERASRLDELPLKVLPREILPPDLPFYPTPRAQGL